MSTAQTKPKTPQEIYLAGQAAADFKPGERVKVAFKVPGRTSGWGSQWRTEMDAVVGSVGEVDRVHGTFGVRVSFAGLLWSLPYFCLERVAPEPVRIQLNDTWTAEVISKDEVKVGCQTFKVERIRELVRRIEVPQLVDHGLNGSYNARIEFPNPTRVTVEGRVIELANLRKLLAAVDSFVG